ncbi:MAG: hypothetical protein J1F67_05085 [Muribaculaceae bacterium]|nr:hypothetical protein [Muribaculaceae bacterium]
MNTLWIERDKDGFLEVYAEKPERLSIGFTGRTLFYPSIEDFPEVTWENSPQQVELKLKDSNGKTT